MTRNHKILSYALALASLSLVCLEAANADATPDAGALTAVPALTVTDPNAIPGSVPVPATPVVAPVPKNTLILAIKTDADAPQIPMETFNLELQTSAANEIEALHYYGPLETARGGTSPRYSLNKVVDIKDIQKGVVLMKIQDKFNKVHDAIKLTARTGFTSANGGDITLNYVTLGIPWGDDETADYHLKLRKNAENWEILSNSKEDNNQMTQMTQMMLKAKVCEYNDEKITCGIESVTHSMDQNPAYSR